MTAQAQTVVDPMQSDKALREVGKTIFVLVLYKLYISLVLVLGNTLIVTLIRSWFKFFRGLKCIG